MGREEVERENGQTRIATNHSIIWPLHALRSRPLLPFFGQVIEDTLTGMSGQLSPVN